ncbi:hypothetical protein GNZ10_25340 [Ralstonia sp. 3N]|uniref:hypothetical protein n=1 Tax=Ralstonia sp. 3N TaxID=2675750 RepID=UPI0015C53D8B|nr:hypothetical protein [Ralstonia sp. 3N]NPT52991.1 hypothetical protein [Ralstonia sp. 3N]
MGSVKKIAVGALLAVGVALGGAGAANAVTVYYKGSAVSWDYGRTWAVYSESHVQSSVYEHHSTANLTPSGWKRPGVVASASQYVGAAMATAYWNCRG